MKIFPAEVVDIHLKDNESGFVHAIGIRPIDNTLGSSDETDFAIPFDNNIKRLPLKGEIVLVVQGPYKTATGDVQPLPINYYLQAYNLFGSRQHNSKFNVGKSTTIQNNQSTSQDYILGNVKSNNQKTQSDKLGDSFKAKNSEKCLQPFEGDLIIEGRVGQFIRMGSTVSNTSNYTVKPTWNGSANGSPILTVGLSTDKLPGSKFVVEDVNEMQSSIWITSDQKLSWKPGNKLKQVSDLSSFNNPQIIANSDRIILSAKKDSLIFAAKSNAFLSTSEWSVDFNQFFDQIYSLVTELEKLALGNSANFATGVGPTGPASNASAFQQISRALKEMKQKQQ
jgi:hypothetical protein